MSACERARRDLVDAQLERLSAARAERVQQHVGKCPGCAAFADRLAAGVGALRATEPPPRSEQDVERVVSLAMARVGGSTRAHRGRQWLLAAAAAAAALALTWVVVSQRRVRPSGAIELEIESGQIVTSATRHGPGSRVAVAAGATAEAAERARVRLPDDSRLDVDPSTRWRVFGSPWCVALERGALTLSVAPRSASAPVLTTPEARIYVAGTQLRVDRAENRTFVAVISGTIEVEDTATGGRARLGAGQRIRVPQPETQSSDPRGGARPAVPRSRSRSVATSRAGAASRVDADDIRRVIRSGDDARAQALIADARRRALGNGRLLAELGILEAEAHVAAGRFRVALDAYLAVSERYPSSQQGEIGLYAAAQLAAGRLGDRARAASLLRTYVERYPHGLFISEARAGVP